MSLFLWYLYPVTVKSLNMLNSANDKDHPLNKGQITTMQA